MSELNIGKSLVFSKLNTPTREGEVVETVEGIKDIPTPREGMIVYVKDEKKNYVVLSLKEKVVDGAAIPNAQVDEYEALDAAVMRLVDAKIAEAIDKVIDGAPDTFDSFREIVDWIDQHGAQAEGLIGSINSLENNGLLFGSFGIRQSTAEQVLINYSNINQKHMGYIGIPSATTEVAGAMSAADKRKLDNMKVVTAAEYEAIPDKKNDVLYFIIEE